LGSRRASSRRCRRAFRRLRRAGPRQERARRSRRRQQHDAPLYGQRRHARARAVLGSWSQTKFSGPSAFPAQPAIVALDPAAGRDELLVYAGTDLLIHVAARVSSNKAWNTAILFDTAASSTDLALQALPNGKALLVYTTSDNRGYYSVWSEATGFAAPTPLVAGGNPELASVPSIARGQCGSDVTIAYAQKDGLVKVLRYSGGTMSGPFDVGGITKATWVGVGEAP